MGLIGRLLSYAFTQTGADIKLDPGGGENRTAEHFQPANMASRPLPEDYVVTVPVPGAGRVAVVAFVDPGAPDDLAPGDAMLYARDSNGARSVSVRLDSDGTLTAQNGGGSLTLEASGNVIINGVTIDTNGNITAPGDGVFQGSTLSVAGKNVNGHTHPQANDSGGNVEQPVGAF